MFIQVYTTIKRTVVQGKTDYANHNTPVSIDKP